jgi:ATP-binding cassette, subfamily B, multidrug efflux pump
MKRLFKYLGPYGGLIVAAIVLLFAQANCDLALPDYLSKIVNIGIQQGRVDGYMLGIGLRMLLLALLSAGSAVLVGLISARISAGLARDLRSAVFAKVEGFSQREFDTFSTASLITRTNNDITQVQMIVVILIRSIVYPPLIGVGGILHALGKNASMWWIIALAVALLVILVATIFTIAVPRFKITRRLVDRLTLVARERLSGIMITRAFNAEKVEEGRFEGANADLAKNALFVNRVMTFMMPTMMLIMNGVSLLIIWIGAQQVGQSAMKVGDMMAFMQYAMQIVIAFLMMSMIFIMLPSAAVSADRVADVLETEASIRDPEKPRAFGSGFEGTVEFRDVSFRYPGAEEDVLHGISFTARPGQTTAIIGATGSGKSSLVNLVPRFYDVSSGSVLVGGIDVRELGAHELRDRIGYVPQKAILFSGTIASNIRFADQKAPDDDVEAAVEIAQVAEFVSSSPRGMETAIAQGGDNVSGGQRQRISIARALLKKPPILILDDCFSALDFGTEGALRRALRAKRKGSTVILVTQRVATVMWADRVVVLDEGRIAGVGDHASLMKDCETYREIASSQLTREELP